jgi:hypothetical protein
MTTLITLLVGCGEKWDGFVYPDKTNLATHIYIGGYESLERCRISAMQALKTLGKKTEGDYECGLNCEPEKGLDDIRICEATKR